MVLPSDRWSARFNSTGLIFYACGLPWLIFVAASTGSAMKLGLALVFMATTTFFWIVQTFYHVLKREGRDLELMRRIDHTTVFFLIDGTFTPVIVVFGNGLFYAVVIGVLWIITIVGSILMVWTSVPRSFSSILSFIMGILGIATVVSFLMTMQTGGIVAFLVGVPLLFVGGFSYAIKKPNPVPGIFTFHEIYHGLSLPAIICLFFLVLITIGP